MVATAILMVLLPKGSPRYIYPLIVVPCLLLGRALSAREWSKYPPLARTGLAPKQPGSSDGGFIGGGGDAVPSSQ